MRFDVGLDLVNNTWNWEERLIELKLSVLLTVCESVLTCSTKRTSVSSFSTASGDLVQALFQLV